MLNIYYGLLLYQYHKEGFFFINLSIFIYKIEVEENELQG